MIRMADPDRASDHPDHELIRRFLAATDRLSLREAAEESGVSAGTVQRFREGRWARMRPMTRRAVQDYLRQRGGVHLLGALSADERVRALELAEELVRLLRGE